MSDPVTAAPTEASGHHVVFIAMTSVSVPATTANVRHLLDHGVRVTVVTAEPPSFADSGLDRRAEVVDLTAGEARHPVYRGSLLGRRLPGVAGKAVGKGYKVLRPAVLWRAADDLVARRIDLDTVSEVVLADAHAVPLGWHLARRHPGLRVSFSLDRARYSAAATDEVREASEV